MPIRINATESATGRFKQQAENRFGVTHLLQFWDRPKCRGWSNRRELRVIERSFFWATYAPLASAN